MPEAQNTSDFLDGVDAIAGFIGIPSRRVRHLISKGEIPVFKLGGRWCARRATLEEFFSRLEAEAAAVREAAE